MIDKLKRRRRAGFGSFYWCQAKKTNRISGLNFGELVFNFWAKFNMKV